MAKKHKRRSACSDLPKRVDRTLAFGALVVLVGLTVFLFAGCGNSDPRTDASEERLRWEVQVLSWASTESGAVNISTRLSGPRAAKLQSLTVRFEMQDASGAVLGDQWHVFDLSEVARGGPVDFSVILAQAPEGVEQISLDRVYDPTPEQEARIPELQF